MINNIFKGGNATRIWNYLGVVFSTESDKELLLERFALAKEDVVDTS